MVAVLHSFATSEPVRDFFMEVEHVHGFPMAVKLKYCLKQQLLALFDKQLGLQTRQPQSKPLYLHAVI